MQWRNMHFKYLKFKLIILFELTYHKDYVVSQLLYCFSIPGNEVIIMLFTSSTALLVGAIMATLALLVVMEFEK